MNREIIRVANLTYKNIFNDFNINFVQNRFITISGPNNCGKTTLIRILDRQIITENTIMINDRKIEDYKIAELSKIVQSLIPKEVNFFYQTVKDELEFYLAQSTLSKVEKKELYKHVIKNLKLTKYEKINPRSLENGELIKVQLATKLLKRPPILLIDDLGRYLTKKEKAEVLAYLRAYQLQYGTTIIMTTNDLNDTLVSDYIYIISNSTLVLEGNPMEVLQKDNSLNKLGLSIPFMIDLSVKLRDYDVVKEIELDQDRMVDKLWN